MGAAGLKDEELLALVLRTGYRGHGVMEVSQKILSEVPVAQLMAMPLTSLARLRQSPQVTGAVEARGQEELLLVQLIMSP